MTSPAPFRTVPNTFYLWLHPLDASRFERLLTHIPTPNRSEWSLYSVAGEVPYELRQYLELRSTVNELFRREWVLFSTFTERLRYDNLHARLAYSLRSVAWGGPGYVFYGIGFMRDTELMPTILELPLADAEIDDIAPVEQAFNYVRKQIMP